MVSFTEDKETAEVFSRLRDDETRQLLPKNKKLGKVIKVKIPVENVYFSYHTDSGINYHASQYHKGKFYSQDEFLVYKYKKD